MHGSLEAVKNIEDMVHYLMVWEYGNSTFFITYIFDHIFVAQFTQNEAISLIGVASE